MRVGLRYAIALASVLTACELAVSTSDLDNGKADAGVDANVIVDAMAIDVDVPPDTGSSSSPDATVDAGRFCDTVASTPNLAFCEDWDQPQRTSPFTNGWVLASPSPIQTITFSGSGEPVFSEPRALKIFQNLDAGSERVNLERPFALGAHTEIDFKVYPTTPLGVGTPFLELKDNTGNCALVVRYDDINTFCPDYVDTIEFPELPPNTWSELKVVIDNTDAGANVSVTGPFGTLTGTAPAFDFTTFQLGQDESDIDQTLYLDDVWATTK